MSYKFQCSLAALGALALGLGCASGDVTQVTQPQVTENEATWEEEGAQSIDIETLLRENEEQIAKLSAEGRSPYTREEASKILAEMGLPDRTYEQLVAESVRKQSLELSAEERSRLSRHFAELAPGENVGFAGRLIVMGDVLVDADELLAALPPAEETVEKGFGCLTAIGGNVGCNSIQSTYLRDDGDGSPDTVDFVRPDTQRTTYVIIADNAPQFFFDVIVEVTTRIEELNPAGDCLGANTFVPIRQSAYDALHPFVQAAAFSLPVTYALDPCPDSNGNPNPNTLGCSTLPTGQTVMLLPPGPNSGGVTQGRMAFGSFLRINTRFFPVDSVGIRGTLYHEFGHLMGRSHNVVSTANHKIPGTSIDPNVSSVLSLIANRPNALSGDDVQVLKTLYSDNPNRSNDSCGYVSGFRNFGAIAFNGCPANSIPNGSQTVCCGPACGTCGGSGCSQRPGGTDACCTGRIIDNNVSCTGRLSGPCVMP